MFNILLSYIGFENKFGFFINAFKYGTPPHGGIEFDQDQMQFLHELGFHI